ncbi:HDOD domain-containing protein [Vibrio sinensis]|uniref:HDOD domain-containing protein n=1 Tax=Vibrio sinensis TaxID=2302434 RepID=A0A3A6QJX0_9VIBR|nr:HDOD domain-containing protein [Vibrio sinensis]RJX72813.1 HDOD domain-containing protein [Vibrio sinensis]
MLLVTNKNYTEEANELARKIALTTKERHAKWLVSVKYILDQSNVDSILSRQSDFCDSVILSEEERVTDKQRLLLECESERVQARRQKEEERVRIHKHVVSTISAHTEKLLTERFNEENALRIFGNFPDFEHFLQIAYSPSLSFSSLSSLTTNNNRLKNSVLELVNDPKFCSRIGKSSRSLTDPKMAIGTLGIDNSRLLFPILMAKPLLKWHDPVTKYIAPKVWQHMILTANVTRLRLKQAGLENDEQGILLGILRTIGYFALVNQFSQAFEDALVEKMQSFRRQNKRNEYYACADVKPTLSILPRLFLKLEKQITLNIISSFEWSPNTIHLKAALIEDFEDVPVLKRSPHGVALAQAQTYSMYDMLERSNVFVEKHKPYFFAHVQMPPGILTELRACNPGRVELAT